MRRPVPSSHSPTPRLPPPNVASTVNALLTVVPGWLGFVALAILRNQVSSGRGLGREESGVEGVEGDADMNERARKEVICILRPSCARESRRCGGLVEGRGVVFPLHLTRRSRTSWGRSRNRRVVTHTLRTLNSSASSNTISIYRRRPPAWQGGDAYLPIPPGERGGGEVRSLGYRLRYPTRRRGPESRRIITSNWRASTRTTSDERSSSGL